MTVRLSRLTEGVVFLSGVVPTVKVCVIVGLWGMRRRRKRPFCEHNGR